MMPCYLHLAATVGADTKGRLSPTINPVGDRCRLDMPVRRQIKRVRQALANTLLDGQARAGLWIVNQCSSRQTLPNRRSCGKDNEVGLLQATGQLIEVAKARRHADDVAAPLVELIELIHVLAQRVADRLQI